MNDSTQLTLTTVPAPAGELTHELAFLALRNMPLRLAVSIPLHGLRLRDLRSLQAGRVFTTNTPAAEDVPVRIGGALLGFAELDSADGRMAIRLTRLV